MFFCSKKFLALVGIIVILTVILVYLTNLNSIPDSIILFEDSNLSLETIAGIKVKEVNEKKDEDSMQISSSINKNISDTEQSKKYNLSLLGINLKTVTANFVENRKVIPLGNIAGLKLYTEGVLVIGTSEVEDEKGNIYKPYEDSGIKIGDSIVKVNDTKIHSTEELLECISKCNGEKINLTYKNGEDEIITNIQPVKTDKNTYKLGLWVRDAAAGIGTLSFYDKQTNSIVSLGHGIQDIDTGNIVEIEFGEFVTTNIANIKKGEKQSPGKIEGSISDNDVIGEVYSNTKFGVYGHVNSNEYLDLDSSKEVNIALRNEIKEGKAVIISTLENGKTESYEVNIQKIFKNNNENNKSMIVKVTDDKLLQKTGGIIQGMSGSPIIQNGKLIGVLTHVLVSDPTTGYGVFADLMVNQLN